MPERNPMPRAVAIQPSFGQPGDDLQMVKEYYRSRDVRRRIAEYCGGNPGDTRSFSALSLAGYGGADHLRTREGAPVSLALSAIASLLTDGADICRSLEDRNGTLLVFDIDYLNPDDPGEPYRDPVRTFERLGPAFAAARRVWNRYGIPYLALMTGRGYHLVTQIPDESPFEGELVKLGECDFRDEFWRTGEHAVPRTDLTHSGAGRLMQFLAHETRRELQGVSGLPVHLIDRPTAEGGPFILLDLSAYGDPVRSRNVRCAFSANQKGRGLGDASLTGTVAVLPCEGEALCDVLAARRDPHRAAAWAADHSCAIPEIREADALLAAYSASRLGRFHAYCDSETPEGDWSSGPHDREAPWPDCALFPLNRPNDALLTPGWIRTVALTLWARGFHPAKIVRLIVSRYAESHEWADYWDRYDRNTRARFYVRASCAAVADELEPWSAFTCDTQRKEGFCTGGGCGVDLSRIAKPFWNGRS